MNIVYLRSGYGKPDSRFEKEVSATIEAGNKVLVIAWDRDAEEDRAGEMLFFDNKAFAIHIGIPSKLAAGFIKNLFPMIKFNISIYKYLRKNLGKFDIIHASDFDTVLPAYYIKKKYKKKLVYDIYDYYADSHHMPRILENIVRRVDTKIINDSDAVIICNEKRKKQIRPANPQKLVIIHNSPERIEIGESKVNIPDKKKFRIVFIGGFVRTGRYIFEMIDVIRKRKDCELIIGGFGSGEDEIAEIAKKEDNIIYVGKQEYQDVLSIEKTADVLTALYDPTLKNHQYAAPNKFYEALMLGKPIICAQNTNIDEFVSRNELGWSIDVPNQPFEVEFNKALDNAISLSQEERKIVEKKAIRLFMDKYDWSLMKKRLTKLYEEL